MHLQQQLGQRLGGHLESAPHTCHRRQPARIGSLQIVWLCLVMSVCRTRQGTFRTHVRSTTLWSNGTGGSPTGSPTVACPRCLLGRSVRVRLGVKFLGLCRSLFRSVKLCTKRLRLSILMLRNLSVFMGNGRHFRLRLGWSQRKTRARGRNKLKVPRTLNRFFCTVRDFLKRHSLLSRRIMR